MGAGRFKAFNSESDAPLSEFLERYRSPAYLKEHPADERLAHHKRLQGIFGKLSPARVVLDLELQLTLLVRPEKTGDALVMRFRIEKEPPCYLAYMTISGIDRFEVPDEYADYVATRAAPVDGELRDSTVRSVTESLRDRYVSPELGQRMADTLLLHQARGLYDDLTKAGALAERLTEDAVAVSHDTHVWVEAENPMAQASTDPINRDVSELRRDNYDFREATVLPGNVGYIRFDMIHDGKEAQDIVAAGLASLAGCDALILDLRDNIGGKWCTADLFLGYLLPGGTVLSRVYDRDGHLVEERVVPQTIPGESFGEDVPVYVLTSARTGSAAEALAYTLKHMGRATLVGEVTRGAAHPSEEVVVNDYFRVSVPFLRSENVNTGTDWEGIGVLPQIQVPAEDALETAIKDARERIREKR